MQVEITTLGAGTFDLECDDKDMCALNDRLAKDEPSWICGKYTAQMGGRRIILNTANIVSIKKKR